MSYVTAELTRKRRGGIIGERSVYASFTVPANRVTHPTTRSVMVVFEDPRLNGKIQLEAITSESKMLTASGFALVEA